MESCVKRERTKTKEALGKFVMVFGINKITVVAGQYSSAFRCFTQNRQTFPGNIAQ